MDPLSITAGVVGMLDVVTRLSVAVSRFKDDYKLAEQDVSRARDHAFLLQKQIRALESSTTTPTGIAEPSFIQAVSVGRELLSDIEASFPLRTDPHTWKSKAKWALVEKPALAQLQTRLVSTQSALQAIIAMEQLRVARIIYSRLVQQQSTMDKIERGEILSNTIHNNITMIHNSSPSSAASAIQISQLSPLTPQSSRSVPVESTELLPKTTRFGRWGFSAQLITQPRQAGTAYLATVQISLFGKLYSAQLRMSYPTLSIQRTFRVYNTVPMDSEMVVACKAGDFKAVRQLLTTGGAHGSDVCPSGYPMLEYAVQAGSAPLVRLLLDYGAGPNFAYGEYNMTTLQSSFLHGHLDISRTLLSQGADIEHVDSDGYSVLSYLWVADGRPAKSLDFLRLCLSNGFSEVNACDKRGWTALHRAAAIGTSADIEAFLKLGASHDQRARWYGWTALFFAASHDNLETFQTLVEHAGGPAAYDCLDGDGWNLLHCCVYFGAPRVMRLVLRSGIDVHQRTLPAPLPEDPGISYRVLTAFGIARYIGPDRFRMFMDAVAETGREHEFEGYDDVFWDAPGEGGEHGHTRIYGAEDVDDRWTLLHWASFNGSTKVKSLLLLKGADPARLDAIMLEDNPTLLPWSTFDEDL